MNRQFILFTFLFLLLAFSGSANAAVIKNIDVSGNQRVEEETIKSYLGFDVGRDVSYEKMDNALAEMYATGLFADINFDVKGSNLKVEVSENPVISEVAFEGNKRVDDSSLSSEVTLGPRSVYSKSAVQRDVKRILEIYKHSGRFAAEVTPKVIKLSQNRINLVYEIDEGGKVEITKIAFVGNDSFNDQRLQSVIKTKESAWYRFFSGDDNYDPDRLDFDRELLRRHYVANGYADFRVTDVGAELTPTKDSFVVTFAVDEGDKYQFGNMTAKSQLRDVTSNELLGLMTTKRGDIFNAKKVEETTNLITEELGNLGYAFVEVDAVYDRNPAADTIGLNYVVKQGPRVYVENVNISGNVRTMDEVIRREFTVAEGDPYNAAKIKRSKQRINNLGFFKNVEINNKPGSSADKVNIDVKVEEQSTGELTFGAGFSTSDGALGDVSIVERNLLGKGQYLKLNFTMASARQEVDLSFTEPYFMNKDMAVGFDLFAVERDGSSSSTNLTFDNKSFGGVLRSSYPVTEYLRHSVKYSLRNDEITNIDPLASTFVKRQEGEFSTSLVGHSLIYDKRDNRFDPRSGAYLRVNQDVAGLGGDSKFMRNEVRGLYYLPLIDKDWVLKIGGNAGHIFGFGDEDVRINHRFFVGSNEIRGFDNQGVGPRDATSRDPLGGNVYATGTAEIGFPLGLPEELGFRGAVFTDVGTLFESDDKNTATSTVLDDTSARASIGVGVSWDSPLGPIRIDISEAYMKEEYDETEQVKFSFGTRF